MSDTENGDRPRWMPATPAQPSSPRAAGSGAVELGALVSKPEPQAETAPPAQPAPPEPAPPEPAPPEPAATAPADSPSAPELAPATFVIRAQSDTAADQGNPSPAAPPVQAPPAQPAADPGGEVGRDRVNLDKGGSQQAGAATQEAAPSAPPARPVEPAKGARTILSPNADRDGAVAGRTAARAPEPSLPAGARAEAAGRTHEPAKPSAPGPIEDDLCMSAAPPRGSPLAGVDPRGAPRERNRSLLVGGLIGLAALSALGATALLFSDRDEAAPASSEATREAQAPTPTQAAFVAPDREAVRDAYAEVGRVYRTAGVSGLAEAGRTCFAGLAEQPSYRGLDYCTALDAFGAAFAQRAAGAPPPTESWFGQAESRFLRTAQLVMGPERDAAARLVDIRRLAIEVARESGPAFAAASPPGAAPASEVAAAPPSRPAGLPPSVALETVAPAPRPGTPPRPAERAPVQRAQAPAREPARPAPDEAERRAYAAAREGPTAAEVAAARPRSGRGPSFNCRGARSTAERLVCSDPELATLDRQLNAAYEDAIAAGVPRRVLRQEQDRWLGVRESAAPDPDAVADVYRRRIQEVENEGG